jgi:hypothetical protein
MADYENSHLKFYFLIKYQYIIMCTLYENNLFRILYVIK